MRAKSQLWLALVLCSLSCTFSPPALAQLPVSVDNQPLPSLAPMLDKVTPAVVNIATRTHARIQENPLFNDPFFRYFFSVPRSRERVEQSLGSGVIIDAKQGYVVTNHHVIDRADEIVVTLRDGRQLKAELIGSDPDTDVALIKVPAENLTQVPLADSDLLRVGDFVVAIGNPFGLGQTVTSGIVSALGRSGLSIHGYEDFIQTDASINPGNSGGALVNLRGELVGINSAILAPSGGNVGIGFAIPSNMMQQVVRQLRDYGEVQRGQLGVSIQNITPDLIAAFNLEEAKGAVVTGIQPNSAAEKAGLQAGDIILQVNQRRIDNSTDLRNQIALLRVGETASLKVLRNGKERTLSVTITGQASVSGKDISPYLEGSTLVEDSSGVNISDVARGSVADRIGLQKGDIIIGINRQPVNTLNDLSRLLQQQRGRFMLRLNRDGFGLSLYLQ